MQTDRAKRFYNHFIKAQVTKTQASNLVKAIGPIFSRTMALGGSGKVKRTQSILGDLMAACQQISGKY